MDGLVPLSGELVPCYRVPPILVKLSVGKVSQLGKAVADAFLMNKSVVKKHDKGQVRAEAEET